MAVGGVHVEGVAGGHVPGVGPQAAAGDGALEGEEGRAEGGRGGEGGQAGGIEGRTLFGCLLVRFD